MANIKIAIVGILKFIARAFGERALRLAIDVAEIAVRQIDQSGLSSDGKQSYAKESILKRLNEEKESLPGWVLNLIIEIAVAKVKLEK